MINLMSNFNFWLLILLGLILGRVGALLTELFSYLLAEYREKELNPKKDPKVVEEQTLSTAKKSTKTVDNNEENPVEAKKLPPIWPFILQYQKEWGFCPGSWAVKKIDSLWCKDINKKANLPPLRPFIIELLMALVFVLLLYFVGWKYILLEYLIFAFALITVSAIDIENHILPDSFTLTGIVIGLLGALLNPEGAREFWPALAGVFMGGGFLWLVAEFYYSLRKEEGLGGGDIKLLAWIGAVLTWKAVPFVILLSCFMGLLTGVLIMVFKSCKNYLKKEPLPQPTGKSLSKKLLPASYLKQELPFGPYLAFSALVYIFNGQKLAEIYLSWFF